MQKEKVMLQADVSSVKGYETTGTLEGWREKVGKFCIGNSRLLTGISASFGAPLLRPLGKQGFGINFRGDSSEGKTTILRGAKSVIGSHEHMQTWRVTASALEAIAAQHNDGLLPLDEMGESDQKEIGKTAYMLANGQGKGRMDRNTKLRETLNWRLIFLSTGEITLAEAMSQVNQRVMAGQEVRLIDITADAGVGLGIFERLPDGFTDGAVFANYLHDATLEQHGYPFIEFLTQLTADLDTHMQTVRDFRAEWLRHYLPQDAASQVKRVADSFATLAAGGELATDFGITGWPEDEASKGVATCFNAWIERRGGVGNQEQDSILRHVQNHFQEHGSAKYTHTETRPKEDKTLYRMGYRDNQGDYFVLTKRFEQELCTSPGFDRNKVIKVLTEKGYLHCGSDGRNTIIKRFHQPSAVDGDPKKSIRVYHIDGSIISGGD